MDAAPSLALDQDLWSSSPIYCSSRISPIQLQLLDHFSRFQSKCKCTFSCHSCSPVAKAIPGETAFSLGPVRSSGTLSPSLTALGWFTLLLYIPNFLPGVIAFGLPENRTIPSYLWPPFVLLLGTLYAFDPARRLGAELWLLLGLMIPRFREITFHPIAGRQQVDRYLFLWHLPGAFVLYLVCPDRVP